MSLPNEEQNAMSKTVKVRYIFGSKGKPMPFDFEKDGSFYQTEQGTASNRSNIESTGSPLLQPSGSEAG